MAENMTLERDYRDTFSVKEFITREVLPNFFPGLDTSNLTTGTIGMVSELIATITEDTFNTGSSLVAESFPTRARMESSIYSNAAIFQLTNAFSNAATCKFVIGLAEEDVIKNFKTVDGSSYKHFYIGKNTIINVTNDTNREVIPFSLDYTIDIRAMYRKSQDKWIYTAKYDMDEYKNSVSPITDPYVRLQVMSNGFIILLVDAHQCVRTITYEPITDNATLNYPTVTVPFSGTLVGFDVLYKDPSDTDYHTQLTPKVIYSLPSKDPFCYYRLRRTGELELSFTTKDSYFQPKFNSELMIITYTSLGSNGNFKEYTGNEISMLKDDDYEYEHSWMIIAKPMGSSVGGTDPISLEALRELTVEGFTTANSITTEHDLSTYFNNFKHHYGTEFLAIKKRNDAIELLFSTFICLKDDDYIFPTNTLSLDTNVQYLTEKEGGFYNLDPGFLFAYKGTEIYKIKVYYLCNETGFEEGSKYDEEGNWYNKDGTIDESKKITKKELHQKLLAGLVTETDRSYYQLGMKDETTDAYYLTYANGLQYDEEPITQEELFKKLDDGEIELDYISDGSYNVDFLFDNHAEVQAKKDYYNYFDDYKAKIKEETGEEPDMDFDEYLFTYPFKEYKRDFGIDNRLSVFNCDVEEQAAKHKFLFTNPFITTISKEGGLISYYQSFVNQHATLDFVTENDDDAFCQFITATLNVERDVTAEKRYRFYINVLPSVEEDPDSPYCPIIYNPMDEEQFILYEGAEPSLTNFNKEILVENNLRMILTFIDNKTETEIGYMELIPTAISESTGQITFEGLVWTDDYVTAQNTIRIVHKCPYCGATILNSANAAIENGDYYCDNCHHQFREGIINTRESDSILLPISNANIKLTAIYRDMTADSLPTNNDFVQFDDTYNEYIWTNVYNTFSDRVVLMQPLEMMRSNIEYKDFYITGNDAMDCTISDVPFIKYSLMAYKDKGMEVTDPLLSDDIGKFESFTDIFLDDYSVIKSAKDYLNGVHLDTKFYNTYGRSTNFEIGEDGEILDTNCLSISFEICLVPKTDIMAAGKELRSYIKSYIESVNNTGTNRLFVSNLMRDIENEFGYVDHIHFGNINGYDTSYQSIINVKIDLDSLDKDERRKFVPDLLTINTNNIFLTFNMDEI